MTVNVGSNPTRGATTTSSTALTIRNCWVFSRFRWVLPCRRAAGRGRHDSAQSSVSYSSRIALTVAVPSRHILECGNGRVLDVAIPQRRRRWLRKLGVFAAGYLLLAYVVLPALWSHYEYEPSLAALPMVTRVADGARQTAPPQTLPPPPLIVMKNQIWHGLSRVITNQPPAQDAGGAKTGPIDQN